MFNFSIESSIFNSFLKRLLLMSTGDQDAVVSFVAQNSDKLNIYYHSKLDKGLSSAIFYEQIPVFNFSGEGLASIYISQLFTIKIPEFVSDNKYPQCKDVNLKFLDNTLNIEFSIQWIKNLVPNKTILNFPLLEKPVDLDNYQNLHIEEPKTKCSIGTEVIEGIGICNFIKSDVTSKESNGIFFEYDTSKVNLISTDSTIAIKWVSNVLNEGTDGFSCILSNPTATIIKNFVGDGEVLNIYKHKQYIIIEVDNRKALVPFIKKDYLIDNIEEFFSVKNAEFVGSLELKPFINAINTVSSNNKDLYKKVYLDFLDEGITMITDINRTTGVPMQLSKKVKFHINSDYISSAAQKLLSFGYTANLYYDENTGRVTLSSIDDKLVFLIQGLVY